MADNVVLDEGAGGDTIAADDILGIKHQRVKLQYGIDGQATDISATWPIPVLIYSEDGAALRSVVDTRPIIDYNMQVSAGNIVGVSGINRFGNNRDIDTSSTPEDIWEGGGVYTGHPTGVAETAEISSDNSNDDASVTGTGARTVQIDGLNEDWMVQNETVSLSGTGWAPTTNSWHRINKIQVLTAGSGGENAGILTTRHTSTTGNIFTAMPVGVNETLIGAYTTPSGKTGYIQQLHAAVSLSGGGDCSARLSVRARESGAVYRALTYQQVTNNNDLNLQFQPPISIPEKTDIKVRCENVSNNNTSISAMFDIILIDN
tara:strand:+ start:1475 stop:2428 length:954 start_codon:yes stop_codon:yes gene_type:complete